MKNTSSVSALMTVASADLENPPEPGGECRTQPLHQGSRAPGVAAVSPGARVISEEAEAERERIAVHEAGHAVAAAAFGRQTLQVTIASACAGGGALGRIWNSGDLENPDGLRRQLVYLAAGGAAERQRDPFTQAADLGDWREMEAIAWRLVGRLGALRDVEAETRAAAVRAERLIAAYRQDVERVAAILLAFDDAARAVDPLGYDALRLLDEESFGRPDSQPANSIMGGNP